MDAFLTFFEQMPVWQKAGWIFLVLAIFWLLEGHYTLRNLSYNKWKHARTNLVFLGFVMAINVVFGLITAGVFVWLDGANFGLLQLFQAPQWVALLLSILVLDLIAQYLVHVLLHKIPLFWRLHLIHHSDTKVDATTGTRHHPLDFILREAFALIAVIIMGMPLSHYLFYRILSVFFTYFTHANIQLGSKTDRAISWVFVSPNMHKTHHHDSMPITDSNYGNMFSIWDRLFGTFVFMQPSQIRYGLDTLKEVSDNDVKKQLLLPFTYKKQL
jgi:sterol desaturase/sphingolipid hydroxylase (fatty acid hydroxylase superfamily)